MTSRSLMIITFVLLSIYSWCATSVVATNLYPANLDGLKNQFQTAMKSFSDVASLHYSLAGIKELGVQPPDTFCNDIKKLVDKSNIESIYHATEAAKVLTNCKLSVDDYRSKITSTIQSYKSTTTLVFNAFYEVAEKAGASIKIDPKQLIKFANYFSTKRHVATLRSAYYLTKAFKHLSDNKNSMPIVVSRVSSSEVNQQNPSVLVSVTNLFGQPVGEMTVTADSAKRNEDGVVVISKQKLTPKASDFTVYELSFYDKKIPRGFYTIHLTLTPRTDGKFIGLTDHTIDVKVTSEVTLENVELNIADRDNAAQVKTYKLTYPNPLSNNLEIDYHQKLIVKFQIKDKQTDEFIRVQQTFLRFTNKQSNKEVIYLAEATNGVNSQYKVEVDLTINANDFHHQSGAYELVLIVGDALLQKSFSWKLNDNIQLSFHEDSVPDTDHLSLYSAKREIIHQFREEEKRPPTIVSLVFSGLTLLPLLILLISWLKLGFNLSGLPLGLSPLGFHISHGAAFALMYFYWKYLDMFQTMRYLALVSIPLFLFGHRVLAILAARREKKA
ncbi:unnamed protein product [Rotaria sp. Silwood1]|nr:unnamed protein product [Rotaria sp. Silwood1]